MTNPCSEISLGVEYVTVQFETFCSFIDPETGEIIEMLTEYVEKNKIERVREEKLNRLLND